LLERSELGRDLILIRKTDDLCNIKDEAMLSEPLLSKQIYRIAISDKVKIFWKLLELDEDIIDSENGRLKITVFSDTVRENDFLDGIEKEEDIVPFALDFDVGFIAAELVGEFVREMVNEGLNPWRDSVTVVGDSLMRDLDPVNIKHESGGFTQRQTVVDMISQNETENMRTRGDVRQIDSRQILIIFREWRKLKVELTVDEANFEQVRRLFEKSLLLGSHGR